MLNYIDSKYQIPNTGRQDREIKANSKNYRNKQINHSHTNNRISNQAYLNNSDGLIGN